MSSPTTITLCNRWQHLADSAIACFHWCQHLAHAVAAANTRCMLPSLHATDDNTWLVPLPTLGTCRCQLPSLCATDDNTWCMSMPTLDLCHHQLPSPCAIGDNIWLIRPLHAVTDVNTWHMLLPLPPPSACCHDLVQLMTALGACHCHHLTHATTNWCHFVQSVTTFGWFGHCMLLLMSALGTCRCQLPSLCATGDKTWCIPLPTLGTCCCHCQHLIHVTTNCHHHVQSVTASGWFGHYMLSLILALDACGCQQSPPHEINVIANVWCMLLYVDNGHHQVVLLVVFVSPQQMSWTGGLDGSVV